MRTARTGQFGLERPAAFTRRPPVPHFVLETLKTLYPARYVYTVYQYIPNPRISELRSLILHSCMSSQDSVESEITCPSTVEQDNRAPRRAANGLGCSWGAHRWTSLELRFPSMCGTDPTGENCSWKSWIMTKLQYTG